MAKRCDRAAIEALMALDFMQDAANIVLVGPHGIGKSMVAQNIASQALIAGHTVLFPPCAAAYGTTPDHSFSSLMRSAISLIPAAMPMSCSNWCRDVIRPAAC